MIGTWKNAKISHKKILLAAKLIREKSVVEALRILKLTQTKSCEMMLKLLNSVVSNAQQKKEKENGTFDINNYRIELVNIGRGKYLNRYQPRAKGSAYPIRKHFANVTISLKEVAIKEEVADGKENKS